jgi:hypothetical protein
MTPLRSYNPDRHGRTCCSHPRLGTAALKKPWIPGTRPGMTTEGLQPAPSSRGGNSRARDPCTLTMQNEAGRSPPHLEPLAVMGPGSPLRSVRDDGGKGSLALALILRSEASRRMRAGVEDSPRTAHKTLINLLWPRLLRKIPNRVKEEFSSLKTDCAARGSQALQVTVRELGGPVNVPLSSSHAFRLTHNLPARILPESVPR